MSERFSSPIPAAIDELWERRDELNPEDRDSHKSIIESVDRLDAGEARVAFVDGDTGHVVVDERAKRAILLSFRVLGMMRSQVGDFHYHDKIGRAHV